MNLGAHKTFEIPFTDVLVRYLNNIARKGQREVDLDVIITWPTGFGSKP